MSIHLKNSHIKKAQEIVQKVKSGRTGRGSLALDLSRFWQDQEKAISDPWAKDCPQMPLGVLMSSECLFDELGIAENWHRLHHDADWALALKKRYNDLAETAVGRRLLSEKKATPKDMSRPAIKKLNDIFEAKEEWRTWSYWLLSSASDPAELEALLDRVERRLERLREFLLPPNWESEKSSLVKLEEQAAIVPLYRSQRGPVTFAMSIYGVENTIYLILDNPDLAARFRDLILRAILERARILDEEAGFTPETAPAGWYWTDDNCSMLNAEMYEFFGYPILREVFARYSPRAENLRGQHSDSDMAHLLPVLSRLRLNSVNFGPTLTIEEIRRHMPEAIIHGQLAPFTLSRNEEVNLVAETLRDFEMSKEKRGVVYSTAGSINNGSRLSALRLIMVTIQHCCRYS